MERDVDLVEKTEYTLLTNIRYVQREGDPVGLHCRALLLTKAVDGSLYHSDVRGFGTEAAWEVFDMRLSTEDIFPFTLNLWESDTHKMLRTDGSLESLCSGYILKLSNGTEFKIYTADSKRPIDVYKRTGDICRVWDVLYAKTAEYWTAPYMPRLSYGPAPNSYRVQRERGVSV